MKSFPFRILFLCIFLPPIFYLVTIIILEGYLQQRETSKLNHLIIQDHEALYEGRYTVKEEIKRNLEAYLTQSLIYRLGVSMNILVKTSDDRILYPAQFRNEYSESNTSEGFSTLPTHELHYTEIAVENYEILNKGLLVLLDIQIKHNSWISNSILVLYIFAAALVLQRIIKNRIQEAEKEEEDQKRIIHRLSVELAGAEAKLQDEEDKEKRFKQKIHELNRDKNGLTTDIDELLEEMEKMEKGLEAHMEDKRRTEQEIARLKEEIDLLRDKVQRPNKRKGKTSSFEKRFRILYKNLEFTDRAIEGFTALPDSFQLKAEEIIFRLNENHSMIPVKRKVFGKGGKMNILEVDFSYSGRLYFQKDTQSKTRIMAIGTKNTQNQDLAFLVHE
ncbi:MAG: hypothetical protein JW932_05675 [Deltaproteobacteria bacterium]|nr:hypothetical protein [Deltaproteobacteria bacterium]